jgi:hypothetical protein
MLVVVCRHADLNYADTYTADGMSSYYYPAIFQAGSQQPQLPVATTTYQQIWDGFGRFMQTVGLSTSVRLPPLTRAVFLFRDI